MAFKPRPPKPEEAKAPEKGPKPYKVSKAKDPDISPPKTFDEMGERIVVLEKMQMRWVGRRSELGRQIDYLQAILRKEGIIPDEHTEEIHGADTGKGSKDPRSTGEQD